MGPRSLALLGILFVSAAEADQPYRAFVEDFNFNSLQIAQASVPSSSTGLPFSGIEVGTSSRGGRAEFWGAAIKYLAELLQNKGYERKLQKAVEKARATIEAGGEGQYWLLVDQYQFQTPEVTHRQTNGLYLIEGETLHKALVGFYSEPSLKIEPPNNFKYTPIALRLVKTSSGEIGAYHVPTPAVLRTTVDAKKQIELGGRLNRVLAKTDELTHESTKIISAELSKKGIRRLIGRKNKLNNLLDEARALVNEAVNFYNSLTKENKKAIKDFLEPFTQTTKSIQSTTRTIENWERATYDYLYANFKSDIELVEVRVQNYVSSLDFKNLNVTYEESKRKAMRTRFDDEIFPLVHPSDEAERKQHRGVLYIVAKDLGGDWKADLKKLKNRLHDAGTEVFSARSRVERTVTDWEEMVFWARELGLQINPQDTYLALGERMDRKRALINKEIEDWKKSVVAEAREVRIRLDPTSSVRELNRHIDEINKKHRDKHVREKVEEALKDLRSHGIYLKLDLKSNDSAATIVKKFEAAKSQEWARQEREFEKELRRIEAKIEAIDRERERRRQRRLDPGIYATDRGGRREPEKKEPGKAIIILLEGKFRYVPK